MPSPAIIESAAVVTTSRCASLLCSPSRKRVLLRSCTTYSTSRACSARTRGWSAPCKRSMQMRASPTMSKVSFCVYGLRSGGGGDRADAFLSEILLRRRWPRYEEVFARNGSRSRKGASRSNCRPASATSRPSIVVGSGATVNHSVCAVGSEGDVDKFSGDRGGVEHRVGRCVQRRTRAIQTS